MITVSRIGTVLLAGVLSLVSQIAILRIATSQLSANSITVSSVLVLALSGLSLGATIFGRVSDRVLRPEQIAFVNLGAASLVSIGTALLGTSLAQWIRSLEMPLSAESICFVAATILPVNFLLGGVIPALSGVRKNTSIETFSKPLSFGTLYSFETLGAAVGSIAITFFMIPQFGLRSSWITVSGIAMAGSVISILLHLKFEASDGSKEIDSAVSEKSALEKAEFSESGRSWLIFAGLLCGCASMGMELVWQRYLAVVFGSDTHSYAIVATVFLVGLSLGSILAARLLRSRTTSPKFYVSLLLLIGLSILFSMWVLKVGFKLETTRAILGWLSQNPLLSRMCFASAVLLVPSVLMGIALPVLVKIWVQEQKSICTTTGQIYGAVFIGNVLGIVACASWLIPELGLLKTAIVLACICLTTAVLVAVLSDNRDGSLSGKLKVGGNFVLLCSGIGMALFISNARFEQGLGDSADWTLEHFAERADHTVAVVHSTSDKHHKRLLIDGVTIGEVGRGVGEKQQFLAHFSFLANDLIRSNVLTIGLGTGILAGELANIEQVNSVTCVELSSAIVEAASFFSDANQGVLNSPKLNLVNGDGVRFLRSVNEKFDVIVSDGKSRPGSAANIPFFSREFYYLCADSLSKKGIFVQWVSIRCDQEELESILKTFAGSFPYGHVAIANPDSLYLVGSASPLVLKADSINASLESISTTKLRSYGWEHSDDFLSLYWLDQQVVEMALQASSVNTFDHPVLESNAWDSFQYSVSGANPQLEFMKKLVNFDTESLFNGIPLVDMTDASFRDSMRSARLASTALLEADVLVQESEDGWLDKAAERCKTAIRYLPKLHRQKHVANAFRQLADKAQDDQDFNTEYSSLLNLSELHFANANDELRMAKMLAENNAHEHALDHLDRAVRLSRNEPRYVLELGEGYLRVKKYSLALRRFESVISDSRGFSPASKEFSLLERATLLKGVALVKLRRAEEGQRLITATLLKHPELQSLYDSHAYDW